jgi:hypothetical protein
MDFTSIWTQAELDQSWRVDEIRLLDNHCSILVGVQQNTMRRACVLLLYAHFEGYFKFIFALYINELNRLELKCRDVNFALVALTLDDLFKELKNPDKKVKEFVRLLPDDKSLYSFARNREFLERFMEFESRMVNIPETSIDTESNLKPVVLRKNLYKLGFNHMQFAEFEPSINRLLEFRNKIAHGSQAFEISFEMYDRIRADVFSLMNMVKSFVLLSLRAEEFKRI